MVSSDGVVPLLSFGAALLGRQGQVQGRRRTHRRTRETKWLLALSLLCTTAAEAQRFPGEESWHKLLVHEGVVFTYLFYHEADGTNGGIVMMLENTNTHPVDYRFKVVFRSDEPKSELEREVSGALQPGQRKTGGHDGLFWVPWKDGRIIASVGVRGYRVTRTLDIEGEIS